MAEERHLDDSVAQMAVAAAIASAGAAGSDVRGWENRVKAMIPRITAMLTDEGQYGARALAKQVGEAQVFRVVFDGYEMEESSKRAVVQLINSKGEVEPIRTNPNYPPHGLAIIDQLSRLQKGTEILVWKAIETMQDRQDRKVRVLVHFQVLKGPVKADAATAAPPERTAERGRAQDAPPSEPGPSAPEQAASPRLIRHCLAQLAPDARGRVVAALKTHGWANADSIPEDKLARALYMVQHDGEEPF